MLLHAANTAEQEAWCCRWPRTSWMLSGSADPCGVIVLNCTELSIVRNVAGGISEPRHAVLCRRRPSAMLPPRREKQVPEVWLGKRAGSDRSGGGRGAVPPATWQGTLGGGRLGCQRIPARKAAVRLRVGHEKLRARGGRRRRHSSLPVFFCIGALTRKGSNASLYLCS